MSGIEIAGLILGAYPVLLSTTKDLRKIFEDVKTWWCFEREFENFLSAVETEHIKYSLSLDILLEGLEIPGEEKENLQIGYVASGWHDVQIQAELRRRIQNRYYDWFIRQVVAMNKAMEDLQKLLPVGKIQNMNSSGLEKEMFRLKTSFAHEKDDLLVEVRDRNDKIFTFLQQASHLSDTRTVSLPGPAREQMTLFLDLQGDAYSLYDSFQAQLCCNCASDHPCGIAVSTMGGPRQQVATGHLKMLFLDGPSRTQLRISSIPETTNKVANSPQSVTDKLEEVSALHQHVSRGNRVQAVRQKAPKALFELVASSIPTFSSIPFRKSRKVLAKQDQPTRLSRIRWSLSSGKQEPESAGKVSPRAVRFADDPPNTTTVQASTDEGSNPINDLCQAIKPSSRLNHHAKLANIGYLKSKSRNRLLLNLDPENQMLLQDYKMESLEAFVKATPQRDARLKLGCNLALAILSLGTSSWIPATWTAKDLFLVRDPAVSIPQPFFSHTSLRDSLTGNEPKSTATQTKASLFALGVLLLELTFRDQMENQPFRAALMGADMKPTATTDLATALMWQQKVDEELGHELADAIKRCLVCMFEQTTTPDLGNSTFVRAVWQQVVKPIESFLSAWNRS